jgi:Histidine phosphatase superfamily (branch 1)
MKNISITITLFALIFVADFACAQQAGRTIFLVRNAEAASNILTAGLTTAGEKRAECLAHTLSDADIKQIFVSDATRTQQTAAPLATRLKIKPATIASADISTLARTLLYGTGNALVVAQSENMPVLVQRLQAGRIAPLGDKDSDRLFVVTVMEGAGTPVQTLHYCETAPSSALASAAPASAKHAAKNQ